MPKSAKAFGLKKFVSVSIFLTTIDQLPTNSCYSLHLIITDEPKWCNDVRL